MAGLPSRFVVTSNDSMSTPWIFVVLSWRLAVDQIVGDLLHQSVGLFDVPGHVHQQDERVLFLPFLILCLPFRCRGLGSGLRNLLLVLLGLFRLGGSLVRRAWIAFCAAAPSQG